MKYKGYYINLFRSEDRRGHIELELGFRKLSYERFPAIEGNLLGFPLGRLTEGEIGCFASHLCVLEAHTDNLPAHIIEDDIILSTNTSFLIESLLDQLRDEDWDILYTDVSVPVDIQLCRMYLRYYEEARKTEGFDIKLLNLKGVLSGSMCSYVVNPKSLGKLTCMLRKEIEAGASLPIDIFLRQKCWEGEINACCTFPFITSIIPGNQTTIEGRFAKEPALAADLLRYSFYVEADMVRALGDADTLPRVPVPDLHRQLIKGIMDYTLVQKEESP